MTINDTWGYKADDHRFKSARALTRDLIDIASKGGNFLLNVGPDATGVIPAPEADRLRDVGRWLAKNGEAIYGTTAGPFARRPAWGRATRRGNTLYLCVFDRPADGLLKLPLHNTVRRASPLADPTRALTTTTGDDGVTVNVPADVTDPVADVVAVELDGPPQPFVPPAVPAADGSVTLSAADATIEGKTAQLEDRGGHANVGFWTDPHDVVHWSADLPAGTFDVELTYSAAEGGPRVAILGGERPAAAVLPATGGWDTFKAAPVGRLTTAGGRTTVAVTLAAGPASPPMDLRQVRLVPRPGK